MYFKRLEIHGFKSFAEPVVIDFHEGITCIVGPNGSGKSNISDAIRWVLGEQSPKALRGGKMEEVIFAGTANRKSRGMAEVTLVIDNSAGILGIDYNEVAITRRMYRSGESEYLINNNQCRLRDIRELIMDTGIGVDGYSIIGQGKIADIVSNKPESRREIFEEAAGIVMYKSKKEEAERKLEGTSTNLDRVNDIIIEIESRIDKLKEDSIKAKEYLELSDQFKDLEINIILKKVDNITRSCETYRNDIEKLAADFRTLTSSNNACERELDQLVLKKEEIDTKLGDTNKEIISLVNEINEITSKNKLDKERLSSIEKERKHLDDDIEILEKKRDSDIDLIKRQEADIDKASLELEQANNTLQERVMEFNVIAGDKARLAEEIDNGNNRLFELHRKATSSESESKSIESLRENLRKRKSEIISLSDNSSKNQNDYDIELEKTRRIYDQEKEKLEQANREIDDYRRKDAQLEEQIKTSKETLDKQQLDLSRISSRKRTIEEMESNYEGYNYGVKSIMKASLSGILGVAADLMEVPAGYEVAIETAMGGAMQNIICETDHDAQVGVRYLKSNKAGRLTFLPVESVKGFRIQESDKIFNERGFIGMASDVVKFQPQYKGIYEYLLGRVAIVDDMASALKMSKKTKGLRFVTLEGEIINASGAITGGTYRNKTANLLERKSEITRLEEELATIEREAIRQGESHKILLDSLKNNKVILESALESKQEIERRMISLKGTISALQGRLEEERDNGGRFTSELGSIDEELSRTEDTILTLQQEAENAKNQISQLNQEVNIKIEKLDKVNKESEKISEEITAARIGVNNANSKKSSIEEYITRIKKSVEAYHREIQEKQTSLGLLEDERNTILAGANLGEGDIEQKKEKQQSLEALVEKLNRDKEVIKQREEVIDDEKRRRSIELNSVIDQKTSLEVKLGKQETQIDLLKDRLWDDFEMPYIQALEMKKENFALSPAVKESSQIKSRIRDLGDVNIGAIKEYQSESERLKFLTEQRDDILTARDELNTIIQDMDRTIKIKFKENFDQVVANFEVIFRELFGGGFAELRLDDENNPLESGIDIIAQPPGKKLQNINLLSGGEKTMTAIALMFAVLKTKPTPFCILDEVEAALDDVNIERFAKYLRQFDNIQFALITHQKETMEHADVLYGVTMAEHGVSKVLSLKLADEFDNL